MSRNKQKETNTTNNLPKRCTGKDEMNFSEFPISTLTKVAVKEVLEYKDSVFDKASSRTIERSLKVAPSVSLGLPYGVDDEVITALIQLAAENSFSSRIVFFTSYQLLSLLGWTKNGQNYNRLKESLLRWTGVTLAYENSWWDKGKKKWQTEAFHIIDNVKIADVDDRKSGDILSSITWNDVVFRSFQAGNVKSLDFEFYKRLNTSIAKRMYRYLDKHFYNNKNLSYPLDKFAFHHIGLSIAYVKDAAQIKRRLKVAIQELEQKGFLEVLSDSERYSRKLNGDWSIKLVRSKFIEIDRTEENVYPNVVDDTTTTSLPNLSEEELLASYERWEKFKLNPDTFPGGIYMWREAKQLRKKRKNKLLKASN